MEGRDGCILNYKKRKNAIKIDGKVFRRADKGLIAPKDKRNGQGISNGMAKRKHVFEIIKWRFQTRKKRIRSERKRMERGDILFALANRITAGRTFPVVS